LSQPSTSLIWQRENAKRKKGRRHASPKKDERDALFDQNFVVSRSIGPLKDRSMFEDTRTGPLTPNVVLATLNVLRALKYSSKR